jgi:arylsulfatase A-like enzyme
LVAARLKGYGRFVGPVAGAALPAGVLAAAGECALGAALGDGRFWGVPRYFYQLLLGVEALWLAFLTAAIFAVAATAYFWRASRRGPVALTSPALFIFLAAACGVGAARFWATVDHPLFHGSGAATALIVPAVFVGTAAAWVGVTAGVYRLLRRARGPAGAKSALSVAALRLFALALLAPFIGAEFWAVWRAQAPRPHKPDVFFVVMDAFRADRLEPYGAARRRAPNIEAFAGETVLFRDAYSASSWTKPAMATAFTSTHPGTHGVNARFKGLPEEAATLAEHLREAGYRTVGVAVNPNMGRMAGMADGFDVLDDPTGGSILEAAGPPTSAARVMTVHGVSPGFLGALWRPTLDGLDANKRLEFWIRATAGPARFFYVHYWEPHTPNPPRPEYMAELKPFLGRVEPARARELAAGKFFFQDIIRDPSFRPDYDDDEVALAKALYDADIRRMDVVIKDLLENVVAAAGDEPEPIVIILADHGEEFLEHGRWLHGAGLHREVAEIPLMFRVPGYAPAVVDGPVSLIDLGPTIVSLVGGAVPEAWEGWDLKPYMAGGRAVPARELLLEGIQELHVPGFNPPGRSIELNALLTGGYYYLKDEDTGLEYVYDYKSDPRQEDNLVPDLALPGADGLLAPRRDSMKRLKAEARARALTPSRGYVPPRLEKSLRALGYVN